MRVTRWAGGSALAGAERPLSWGEGIFGGSGSSTSQVARLQQQVVQLRAQLSGAQLSKAEYAQLHKLLLVAGGGGGRRGPGRGGGAGAGGHAQGTPGGGGARGGRRGSADGE